MASMRLFNGGLGASLSSNIVVDNIFQLFRYNDVGILYSNVSGKNESGVVLLYEEMAEYQRGRSINTVNDGKCRQQK